MTRSEYHATLAEAIAWTSGEGRTAMLMRAGSHGFAVTITALAFHGPNWRMVRVTLRDEQTNAEVTTYGVEQEVVG